jgi:hypothetical protein
VDETGHSGDSGPASSGAGRESRDRTPVNGWATPDSPWSSAGAALDPEDEDLPAWRHTSAEIRPFARQPLSSEPPSGDIRPFGAENPSGEVRPSGTSRGLAAVPDQSGPQTGSGFETSGEIRPLPEIDLQDTGDAGGSGELRVPVAPRPDNAGPSWSGRFSDLLHLPPNAGPGAAQPDEPVLLPSSSLDEPEPDPLLPGALRPPIQRPDTLGSADKRRAREAHGIDEPPPGSAPPYPYEGDLDDARREASRPLAAPHRGSVPLSRIFPAVRPAAPGGRRVDWIGADSARHAVDPGAPPESPPPAEQHLLSGEASGARAAYDPATFPRRLPHEPTSPAGPDPGDPVPPAYPGALPGESVSGALPQRVPAEPDVPTVPEPPSVEPSAETPALARIATHLRRGDVLADGERQEGFDVRAILAAVQEVEGVREASLRTTPQGAHSLRLDLAEGADPADVSRQVARLLQDRMGLDASMQGAPTPAAAPPASGSAPVPFVPTQPIPTGRASVVPPARPPLEEIPGVRSAIGSAPVSAPAAETADPLSHAGPGYVVGPSTTAGSTDSALSDVDCGPAQPLAVGERPGPRVIIENVQVNTFGTEATVEVRLGVGGQVAAGAATGPAVDGYLLRLCATATAHAVDELLSGTDHAAGPARCFVEHAASVPFGPVQVAVVVLLLSCGNWVEQLAGSAVVTGDDRHAVVRATLAAVNRRLEALLSR